MEKYKWLNEKSRKFLSKDYLRDGETAESRIRDIAERAEKILAKEGFADKFEEYMSRGYYSLSSPVWANFGRDNGLPCSCNGSYIPDDMAGIMTKASEVAMMSKYGSGTSGYFGDIRPRGSKFDENGVASGPVHFMRLFDCVADIVSQSSIRRGSFAAYLPIEHPDLKEFLMIRSEGNPIQEMSIGVTVSDEFMEKMIAGDKDARERWVSVIKKRFESGYPYIYFKDTVNKNKPQVYKDKSMEIYAGNLCSEICIPSSKDESFVCNLSSMNLLYYDSWKETDAVQTMIYFLDAVMTEYIDKCSKIPYMQAATKFAARHRALGLGSLGWHSYLQSKMVPFESFQAKLLNSEIHKFIRERAEEATKQLAGEYGEPELLKGYGRRNTTLMAIAPTKSSSFILGQVSEGVEPIDSNYYVKDLAKGKFTYKNPFLKKLLEEKELDTKEVWKDILSHGGSVQHRKDFTEEEKDVFKTFGEISQMEIVKQAAQRQQYIDQSQSINLTIHADTSVKDVNALMIEAWTLGMKSLYYQRSANIVQQLARNILTCSSCES